SASWCDNVDNQLDVDRFTGLGPDGLLGGGAGTEAVVAGQHAVGAPLEAQQETPPRVRLPLGRRPPRPYVPGHDRHAFLRSRGRTRGARRPTAIADVADTADLTLGECRDVIRADGLLALEAPAQHDSEKSTDPGKHRPSGHLPCLPAFVRR